MSIACTIVHAYGQFPKEVGANKAARAAGSSSARYGFAYWATPSAVRVSSSSKPVGARPRSAWKRRRALCVFGPQRPLTAPAS